MGSGEVATFLFGERISSSDEYDLEVGARLAD